MEILTQPDKNFDTLATKFQKNIYGSVKGRLRLELLWDDLNRAIPPIAAPPKLSILDAGGGFGQISGRLAALGHEIVLCDISEKMLEQAADSYGDSNIRQRIRLIHSPFQELPESFRGQFDVVMLHAVLEWLAEPAASLSRLLEFLKPGGYLSLMFYNIHSLIYRNAIQGNFRKIMRGSFSGAPNSLSPATPISPSEVESWLEYGDIRVLSRSGIRVFYDYMNPALQQKRTFEDVLALEKKFYRQEPYASLGRYVHVVGIKK